jgi:hypothetical protein
LCRGSGSGVRSGRRWWHRLAFVFDVPWQSLELIDEEQRVHRRDLKSLAAGLAHHLVVDTNEMVAQLRELCPIAFIGAWRQPILLRPPYPPHRILIRASAPRATQSLVAIFVLVEEEGALV